MTYIDPQFFADLDPTEAELEAVGEALTEVEAEEAAGLLDGYPGADAPAADKIAYYEARARADDDEWATAAGGDYGDEDDEPPDGPWDDQLATLAEIGDQVDARHTGEAVRVVADITDQLARRPSSEAVLARSLQRIGDGDYLPDPYFRGDPAAAAAARDPLGRWAAACGPLDDMGRCASRYHAADCHTTIESAAARGSAEEASAWADTLQGRANPPGTSARELGLATPTGMPGDGTDVWAADLLETGEPGVAAPGLHARLLHYMGEADAPAAQPRPDLPDVAAVREALGI